MKDGKNTINKLMPSPSKHKLILQTKQGLFELDKKSTAPPDTLLMRFNLYQKIGKNKAIIHSAHFGSKLL